MGLARPILALSFATKMATLLGASLCAQFLHAELFEFGGPTMGTTYHVKIVDTDVDVRASIQSEIEGILADVDRRLSTYRSDSEVSQFNRAPKGEWFAVSRATEETVSAALEVSQQTGGAVDITVGPLVRLWHFGPHAIAESSAADEIVPPDDELLERARKQVGYQHLEVRSDPPALRKRIDGLEVDLSCIGEGDAIDRIAGAIARRSMRHFLVELGGEVRASGMRAEGKPWRVAVQRPLPDETQIQQKLVLRDGALSTSGDYRRFFERNGMHYSHIIDPSTGRPIEHSLVSVTVAAEDCRTADIWATALTVLGPEHGFAMAESRDIKAFFITRDSGHLATRETRNWRLQFGTPPPH